jgi:hypothetical protein
VTAAILVELAQNSIKEKLVGVLDLPWHEGSGTEKGSPRLEFCQQDIRTTKMYTKTINYK